MKSENKTKKELIAELEAFRERVSELERRERNSRQALGNFGERTDRSSAQMAYLHEAMFVIFDRKFEFINDRFAELFDVSPEEACSCHFDPMTLIAPESSLFIEAVYRAGCRAGCRGSFVAKEFRYTGLSKGGLKIECKTFFLFIPYKGGVAIHGTLHGISVSQQIDEALQGHRSDFSIVPSTVATEVQHADGDHLFMQANKTVGKSNSLPMEQIPRVDYPVTLPSDAAL